MILKRFLMVIFLILLICTMAQFHVTAQSVNQDNIHKFVAISGCSRYFGGVIGLKFNGTVWSWGRDHSLLHKIEGLNNITNIASGDGFHVALKNDGTVWAWGNNQYGCLGNIAESKSTRPVQIEIDNVMAIDAGFSHVTALKRDGTLWSWGDNSKGQLGDGTNSNRSFPVRVNLTEIAKIECGDYCTYALTTDGQVFGWGYHFENTPVHLKKLSNIV